jgi:type I restriction enzyme S subunit
MRVPLYEIIRELESGVSVNGEDRPALAQEVGVLKVSSVTGGVFRADQNKAVTSVKEAARLSVSPRAGDILMTRANGSRDLVGCCVFVSDTFRNLYLSDKLWRVVLKDPQRDSSSWLFQLLNTAAIREYVVNTASGSSGMRNISKEAFLNIPVYRPPIDEQISVARTLNAWDRAAQHVIDLIAAKLRFKRGVMQQLLTGKRRFPEFGKAANTHHTPCGVMPVDWRMSPLNRIIEEVKRKNNKGVTRVLTASGVRGLVDQRQYFNRKVAGEALDKYYLLLNGEFAYNRSLMKGYPYGATKRLDDYDSGVLSTLYMCFRLISDECLSDFLVSVFESGVLNSQLRGIARMGARAHGLLNVTADEFFDMVVPLPCRDEQRQIVGIVGAVDHEIELLRKELDSYKTQKKGLMQKLLTGQVRVKP